MRNYFKLATAADFFAFLTILSALPYSMGEVAAILPPEVKKWVAVTSAIATLILRTLKRNSTPPPPSVVVSDQNKPTTVIIPAAMVITIGITIGALFSGCAAYDANLGASYTLPKGGPTLSGTVHLQHLEK